MILLRESVRVSIQKREDVKRTYTVEGREHHLDELEKLLAWIAYCGAVGHSGSAEISVDGDGSAHLTIKGGEIEKNKKEITDIEPSSMGKPELKVGIV